MKKMIASLSALLFLLSAAAQEQYIEVVVHDTLLLEPQQWMYRVQVRNTRFESTETGVLVDTVSSDPQQNRPAQRAAEGSQAPGATTLAALKSLVRQSGGRVMEDDATRVQFTVLPKNTFGPGSDESITAVFTSRRSLEQFVRSLQDKKDVEGRIVRSVHLQEAAYQEQLNARLLEAARRKAAQLAQLSGKKAGPVVLVSEVTTQENPLISFFESLMRMGMSDRSLGSLSSDFFPLDKIKLEKSLRVRFAMQ